MAAGIHHITMITRKVQANVDFYVGFLGLRLVKRTGGFEDAAQLHLFYGDAAASPGSLITFLVSGKTVLPVALAMARWARSPWRSIPPASASG